MRQVAEGHGRHVRMDARRRVERRRLCRNLRVDPKLVMKTRIQLQARLEVPRRLSEDLVLFVGPWKFGIGARLAVVVAEVLISTEEP